MVLYVHGLPSVWLSIDVDSIDTQDGTSSNDEIQAAAATGDGFVVLAGYTFGEWSEGLTGEECDFAAVKLDANGTEVWRWQVIVVCCYCCCRDIEEPVRMHSVTVPAGNGENLSGNKPDYVF